MLPLNVRRYVYSLLTPVAALAVFYGLMSEAEVSLWIGLGGVVLLGSEGALAAVNTPAED